MTGPSDDLDRLMAVMDAAFDPHWGEAWNRRQVEDALVMDNCHMLLVDESGQAPPEGKAAAGFCLSRTGFEEEELLLFAVVPAERGKGLGRQMLAGLAEAARLRGAARLFLEMRANNPAESLYHAAGFRQIGLRPRYYRTSLGEQIDAKTYCLDL